tara:strand:+ start:109 stop:315 length:207 start_codon:yes stop_codon:yes gene_type:complete
MKKIKFLSNKTIKFNGEIYKPYTVGNLPPSFGFKNNVVDGDIKKGISEWFNYKGLTYIKKEEGWYDAL